MTTNANDLGGLAARLASEREDRGWSKRETARRLFAADDRPYPTVETLLSYVKRWETGKGGVSRRWRAAYAKAFDIPEDALFAPRADAEPSPSVILGQPPHLLGAVSLPVINGQVIDARYVESIRHTNQALVKLDTLHGGDDLLPLALRVFRDVHRKLAAGTYQPRVERDLIAATGETGEIAAWLAYDADRQVVSRQLIHEALMLSRQAGDEDMERFELTHLAMQSVHLRRPAEALRIASDLLEDGNLAPRVTAIMEIRRGRALAQLGDGKAALAGIDKARALITDGIVARDPYWTWWVTDAEVVWHLGMARADLGDWGGAIPLLQESVVRRAAYRRARYNDLAHLLNALVHVAEWREVEPMMAEVADLVHEVSSSRTTNLLRRITARVARANAPSTVTDLAEVLGRTLVEDFPTAGG